jgi:hypothetical protein
MQVKPLYKIIKENESNNVSEGVQEITDGIALA